MFMFLTLYKILGLFKRYFPNIFCLLPKTKVLSSRTKSFSFSGKILFQVLEYTFQFPKLMFQAVKHKFQALERKIVPDRKTFCPNGRKKSLLLEQEK